MNRYLSFGLVLLLAGCAHLSDSATREGEPSLARRIPLPELRGTRPEAGVPGRIDHAAYDPNTQRLFVAALENNSLEVLDLSRGKRIQSVKGLSRPQGAAVVPALGLVAVACGGDGALHVYDTKTLAEKKTFIVGPDADNVRYDATNGHILVSYGNTNSGAIAVFNPQTWAKVREFTFPSRPESFQLDPAGNRLFANLPKGVRSVANGQVAVMDLTTTQPIALITLKARARNFPMAFDAANQRLFIATRLPARLMEIDTRKYEVVADTPCTDDSDDLFYDAKRRQLLVIGGGFRPDLQTPDMASPCNPKDGNGGLDVFEVGPSGGLLLKNTLSTAPHARTGLFVPARDALYVFVSFHGEHEAEVMEYCPR